jgi:hypothetical protein
MNASNYAMCLCCEPKKNQKANECYGSSGIQCDNGSINSGVTVVGRWLVMAILNDMRFARFYDSKLTLESVDINNI